MTSFLRMLLPVHMVGQKFIYSSDFLPRAQSLLAHLADVDGAYERRLEAAKQDPGSPAHKRQLMCKLQTEHAEERSAIIRELEALERRVRTTFPS